MTASSRTPAAVRIAPFAVFIVLMAAQPILAGWLAPVLDDRWLYGLRSLVTAVLLVALWRHYRELRDAPTAPTGAWLLAAAVGVGVFILWIRLDFPPLVLGGTGEPYTPLVNGRIHWGLALTRLAGSALVVPVMEELFWRSFLMRWLQKPRFLSVDPRSVGWKPLVISSVVFALEHPLWFAGLLAGLAYGELYRRTGNLWLVILAHALTNTLLGAYVLRTGSWGFW
jgi:uncharacterized protein